MKLTIEIEMDNAAFGKTGEECAEEVRRVLNTARLYGESFEPDAAEYDTFGKLNDSNGKNVGTWTVNHA